MTLPSAQPPHCLALLLQRWEYVGVLELAFEYAHKNMWTWSGHTCYDLESPSQFVHVFEVCHGILFGIT